MSFGFFARGNAGNLIIDDTNPVLVQRYTGSISVSSASRETRYGAYFRGYGRCDVRYPAPITSSAPPLVFGTPDYSLSGGGIGHFTHRGQAGNWTGFSVTFIAGLTYPKSWQSYGVGVRAGQATGWQWRACTFSAPPSTDGGYGLRLWSADGSLIFDSGWPIVPFRGLLRNWVRNGSGGYYDPFSYWGNSFWNSTQIDDANRYGAYTHAWPGGDTGVLLSSLCAMDVVADTGERNTRIKTIPMIGFPGLGRSHLHCTLAYGTIQHAGTAGPALNNFGLLTADFSRV